MTTIEQDLQKIAQIKELYQLKTCESCGDDFPPQSMAESGLCVWCNDDYISIGDKVRYKDGDKAIYTVLTMYSDNMVGLSLADYDDIEQDEQTSINDIYKFNTII